MEIDVHPPTPLTTDPTLQVLVLTSNRQQAPTVLETMKAHDRVKGVEEVVGSGRKPIFGPKLRRELWSPAGSSSVDQS